MKNVLLAVVFFNLLPAQLLSQQTDTVHIRPLVELIDLGRAGEVRVLMPTLTAEYPSDPGIRFLNAVFEPDAEKAVMVFRDVVEKHPATFAGEAAARRLIMFYSMTGNSPEADRYKSYLKGRGISPELSTLLVTAPSSATTPVSTTKKPEPAKPEVKPKPSPVKPMPPPSTPTPVASEIPEVTSRGKHFVQIGAYTLQSQANKGLKTAEKAGFKGKVIKEVTNNRIFYKVRLGPYATQTDARASLNAVTNKMGINGFIVEE